MTADTPREYGDRTARPGSECFAGLSVFLRQALVFISIFPLAPYTASVPRDGRVAIARGRLAAGVILGASTEHFIAPSPAVNSVAPMAAVVPSLAPATDAPIRATITKITDGDTVDAKLPDGFEHSIRLAGIDAPESAQAFRRPIDHASERANFGQSRHSTAQR